MSSLIHPFQSASQKCRPKHQVLILRCYPKFQKNVQDVKPNSSELSYLLYYASTRRMKLVKVGAFLEKKTASDVWRLRLGNVQVTLQILTALIEKCPRDITLFADSILKILETILRSKDINMVEETLPMFEAYCKNADVPALVADQSRTKQYLNVVHIYTGFATPDLSKAKPNETVPLGFRWRTASLRAIRAIVGSDAVVVDSTAQLNAVMPVILENLDLEDGKVLGTLQERAQTSEKESTDVARKRRLSVATVTTVDTADVNPAVGTETTADADKVAEEEVRILAVRCLKQIFSISTSSTRGQTRLATALTLKFIASEHKPEIDGEKVSLRSFRQSWAASLFEAIARWSPVQDRFVIVLTAVETLVRSPIVESILEKQLVLAQMVSHLLKSDINLIGLSVMDVQLGLIQHMLLLLQLGSRDSKVVPYQPQHDVAGLYKEARDTFDPSDVLTHDLSQATTKDEVSPSPVRKQLLEVIEQCISDLGTHIYYSDQIADMITAILARLKPSAQSEVSSTTAAINNPVAAVKAIADSASIQEDPATDSFFSFATARVVALKAVKDIIITANNRRTSTGAHAEVRSRVGIQVWEGTQWLLKDEDQEVRFAYVDALITWLKLETNKSDLLLPKDGSRKQKPARKDEGPNGETKLARRAVSNASRKEHKAARTTFHQLLHLAIYDNALDFAEQEQDILMLHVLLSNLVERLGVNSIRTGLPMMVALQNTALNGQTVSSPRGQVNIASLVHGYLLAILEKFDLETTKIGQEINLQISRRRQIPAWLKTITVPTISVGLVRQDTTRPTSASSGAVGMMKPFLDVSTLVDEVSDAYDKFLMTPPASPPTSPGRVFSVPTLGFGYGYGSSPTTKPAPQDQMPQKVKDEMCGQWSRESCIANADKENAASLAGSRAGGSGGVKQHLGVGAANGTVSGRESPQSTFDANAYALALGSGLSGLGRQRQSGWSGSAIHLTTTSSRDSTMRVSDLKRALSSANDRNDSPLRRPLASSRRSILESDDDSDSMMSWNEVDETEAVSPTENISKPATAKSHEAGNMYHDQVTAPVSVNPALGEDIPPVPKIPAILNLPGTWPLPDEIPQVKVSDPKRLTSASRTSVQFQVLPNKPRSRPVSRAGPSSVRSQNFTISSGNPASVKQDLAGFLSGIDTGVATNDLGKAAGKKRLIVPPY